MDSPGILVQLRDFFWSDPLLGVAVAASVIALATTPTAFAILGRLDWFQARRGRTYQRPSFAAVVCAMMLVMGIPAIFCALAIKSRYFDKNRYEFDPNRTWTVFDQGRGYQSREEIDRAIRNEMELLANERKNLVDSVKKLDEAMLALRAASSQSPAVAQTIPNVLQRLAKVRQSIGLDGPQQLMDFTAPPVELASATAQSAGAPQSTPAPAVAPSHAGVGAPKAPDATAELAAVPEAQRAIASMLPLTDVPSGWTVGNDMAPSGHARLETFNADNLFEKINGRAESFIQYDVKGMAYTSYHPVGDDSGDVQLYIFEMGSQLKALGKYGSEKPDDAETVAIGSEGYTSAGSVFFYAGAYYTQLVSNKDDPKYAMFALELARRVAARQMPAQTAAAEGSGGKTAKAAATPEGLFSLLPAGPKRSSPKYVAQDVFGYSFLSDVFMADYQEGSSTWQGFLRPYSSPEEAKAVFEKYVTSAKQDGADLKKIEAEGADQMVLCSNVGLFDVIFLKGNAIGGANGATEASPAETFGRAFAKTLPATVPAFEASKSADTEKSESNSPQNYVGLNPSS